jgi:hypothetical protein
MRNGTSLYVSLPKKALLTVCDDLHYCGVYMKSYTSYLIFVHADVQSPVSGSSNLVASWTATP